MWSLTINGVTKTLAEWRIQGVRFRRQNMVGDSLTFTAPRAGFDAQLCDYGDTVTLLRNGVAWFTGTNQTIPDSAQAESQFQSYSIVSPWRWLAENVFQQLWYNGTLYTSHIITVGRVGANVKAVLDYAIANGANLQYLLADLDALLPLPPTNEFTEKTCAQVILEQLQFAPDTVVWFDYTTTPPTLRFAQRGSLTAVALRMAGLDDATKEKVAVLQLTARPDLQVPSVKLMFEVIEEVDGVQYLIPSVDKFPIASTGREDGAFNATLIIQGRSIQNVYGELECETIDTDSIAWWTREIPVLNSSLTDVFGGPDNVTFQDRDGNEIAAAAVLPRQLLPGGGVIAPWMVDSNGDPIEWQTVIAKATFFIETYDVDDVSGVPTRVPVRSEEREFSVELITTNAPAGTSSYSAVASVDSGDALPVGLAAYLYASMSELHYDGSFTLQQAQCDGVVNLGNVINLHGSRTAHATMRALVQEVTFDIDSGTTNILCGPPRHLSLTDVLALLQRFRVRRRWTNPDTQETGELSAGNSDLELGKAAGNTNSVSGGSIPSYFTVKSSAAQLIQDAVAQRFTMDGTKDITADASVGALTIIGNGSSDGSIALRLSGTNGKTIQLREIGVCVGGVNRRMIVLGSEIYG